MVPRRGPTVWNGWREKRERGKIVTDKQIAMAYVCSRLWGWIPDYDELRYISGKKLSEKRCDRISGEILALVSKIRQPLIDKLAKADIDTY